MNEKNTKYLLEKYPKIFRQHILPMSETCMCWGFECGDGWLSLIDNLCGYIQRYIDSNPHICHAQLEATQVKEKFGGLRFYHTWVDNPNKEGDGNSKFNYQSEIEGAISFAGYLSTTICEKCGLPGEVINKHGWLTTLCECCKEK